MTDAKTALSAACQAIGLDSSAAELVHAGENTLYRLPGHIIARVTREGQFDAAAKEVRVSRWLRGLGVGVIEALPTIEQPVPVDGRAVTFWRELPEHRFSTLSELADVLRRLHSLPTPNIALPEVTPFVRQRERIAGALLTPADRDWLLARLSDLEARFSDLPTGRPWCAVHGDVWAGNVLVTRDGPVLLDLERFAYGPPEWDLTSIAIDYTTFGYLSVGEWADFCQRYGYDVTAWAGFEMLRDARELRKVTFALQLTAERPDLASQAAYRLECIQGRHGPRPWGWTGVP